MDKDFLSLTAADVMSRNVIFLPGEMSLQGAARLLARAQVSGAPVVDSNGRCIGVMSTTDFLPWVENGKLRNEPRESAEDVCHSWRIFDEATEADDTVERTMTHDPLVVTADRRIGELRR